METRLDFADWNMLSEMEERLSVLIGWERRASNRRKGREDKKYSMKEGHLLDIQAAGSELMFCKIMNLYPELSCLYHWGMKDCYLQNGMSVDVKMRMGWNEVRSLEVPAGMKEKSADVYALMIGRMPIYKFLGWADGDDVFKGGEARRREIYGSVSKGTKETFYHVNYDKLREPQELLELNKRS